MERVSEYRLKVAQAREIWILVRYPKFDLTEKGPVVEHWKQWSGLVDEDDACALDAEEFEDLEGESNIVKTRTPSSSTAAEQQGTAPPHRCSRHASSCCPHRYV